MINAEQRQQLADEGFCIFPEVLSPEDLALAREGLERGVRYMEEKAGGTHIRSLDPNDLNIRIVNLPAIDRVFIDILTRDDALAAVDAVLGPHTLVSNFTANIALPGSKSMKLHSDQALAIPGPWLHPWTFNIVWCLDAVHAANGATLYLPGSHRYRTVEDVPSDAVDRMVPFEAPAGSFIAMEGRLWHTSGANITKSEQRRMMFAYYVSDFIRPTVNWSYVLPANFQAEMNDKTLQMFSLQAKANSRIGAEFTNLEAIG